MTPSPDARSPSRAVGKVKNVAGWSSPVAREAHNLEVTGSNPVPATFFTPAGPSMAPAGCFFARTPGLQPGSPAVCPIHGPRLAVFMRGLLPRHARSRSTRSISCGGSGFCPLCGSALTGATVWVAPLCCNGS